jgi:hypothetical protein
LSGIVSGFILALLVVGMFSFSGNLGTECNSENSKVSSPISAYENVTTHEGDLIISGTQVFAIENCTFIQRGNIHVRDRAKLVVRNSELCLNQTYPMQYNPTFGDYGTLEAENSTLVSYQVLNIEFHEHSEANFNDVTLNLGFSSWVRFHEFSKVTIYQSTFSNWNGLNFDGYSEASITDSKVTQIQVADVGTCDISLFNSTVHCIALTFRPSQMVKIDHLLPGFYEYMSLQEAVTASGVPCKMTLNNTLVEAWAVHVYYDAETQISDSIISERLGINIQGLSLRIDDLRPQFFEYKKIGQITLNRTSIDFSPFLFVYDSTVTVTNSSVWLAAVFNSDIHVSDSIVACLERIQNSSLFFERTVVEGIEFFYNDFFMYGNVSFESTWSESTWFSSNVTRNYNIIAEDTGDSPMENVKVTLFDQNHTSVWNGTTNSLGQADFNVTFTDMNYTDTLRLEAFKENCFAAMNISLLSNTPIILTLRYFVSALAEDTIFTATSTGTYRFSILEGAWQVCPPQADPSHPESWGWNTETLIYKNRQIEWESGKECNNPTNWDFSVGDGVLQSTYELAEEIGNGMFVDIHLEEDDYLALVANDAKGNFIDNSGGIYFSIIILEHMPVVSFSCVPEKPTAGSQIVFNASASYSPKGSITGYEWNFGDGNTTTVAKPTIDHSYHQPGKYNVTLKVTDNNTMWNTTSHNMTVYYETDFNRDAKVNIQDITIVAVAYGSRRGDPKWNAMADLDKNGWINIIDMTMVAKDYGKSV